jgi:hypothetical protein
MLNGSIDNAASSPSPAKRRKSTDAPKSSANVSSSDKFVASNISQNNHSYCLVGRNLPLKEITSNEKESQT